MILMSTGQQQRPRSFLLTIQQLCACYCGLAIIVAAVLSGEVQYNYSSTIILLLHTAIDHKKYEVYVALCEWLELTHSLAHTP